MPITSDTPGYIEPARNLNEGKGLLKFSYHTDPVDEDAEPLKLWPPGFPLLIFILISVLSLYYSKIDFKNEVFIIIPLLLFPTYFSFHKAMGGLRYLLPSFSFLFVFVTRVLDDSAKNLNFKLFNFYQ